MKYLPAIVVLLMCGCSSRAESTSVTSSMHPAPLSELLSINGRWNPVLVDIHNQEIRPFESGVKALVMVFVLQDCPIANSYMPELNRLRESFAPRGIGFCVMETDPQITLEQARKHADDYQVQWPVVMDVDHQWVKLAGAKKTPEVVVFSPIGEILYRGRIDDRYVALGKRRMEVTSHDLQDALDAILAEKPVPTSITEAVGCFIPELPKKGK